MKSVFLLRHAKSDWDADYERDHERPLSARGRAAAALMGRYLAVMQQEPDRIASSSAVRARDTVARAISAGAWSADVEVTPALYEASLEQVLEVIQAQDASAGSLLLAGHEPTWSAMAGVLIGGASFKFPTAALARIDFDVDGWDRVGFGRGYLVWFVTPKLLARTGFTGD
ncbi:MAG: histidine phosphatase family protein [bacterium]|nr:histidine phosphatase family protein [bacterium]